MTLLDLWASWCEPCLVELPHLQAIHERLAGAGLRTVAVNVDDPPDVARATIERLGLSVEQARPSEALTALVRPRSLPTLLLVDPAGRIRERWNGYRPGVEVEVERAARALLEASGAAASRPLGRASGEVAYGIRWARDLGGPVSGVAIEARSEEPRILAAVERDLVALRPGGEIAGRAPAPQGTGRIDVGDVTGDGRPDVIGWRPGSARVGILDLAERAATSWTSAAPVFGVGVVSTGSPDRTGALALATVTGLHVHAAEGTALARVDGRAVDVAEQPVRPDGVGPIVFLDGDGDVVHVGTSGETPVVRGGFPDARRLLPLGPNIVLASGAETFLAGPAEPVAGDVLAVARSDGAMYLLEASTGRVRFRCRWEHGVQGAAVADLDADGVDEIVVATGKDVVVLEKHTD